MNKILLIFLGSLLYGCLDKVEIRDIKVYNKSNNVIYCLVSRDGSLKDPYLGYNDIVFENCFKIEIDTIGKVCDKPRNWDTFISQSEGGKLQLFIILKDSVNKYGWKDILSRSIYSRSYELDINDLNKLKWQIVYNGE